MFYLLDPEHRRILMQSEELEKILSFAREVQVDAIVAVDYVSITNSEKAINYEKEKKPADEV